ncbi:guanine deaminase [Escherichia coli TA206]|uniref:guanine deaminase n=1 Tax=Escherichia coli TaxID=562 RepID=UPI0001E8AA63|nr:guanine deaminase [Escherichia coli]EGI25816.1 guanine deaminase [Escherichia coli TA206]
MSINHFKVVVKGQAYSASSPDNINYMNDALFCIDQNGYISDIYMPQHSKYSEIMGIAHAKGYLHELHSGQYILPGFIDLHIHAPQWPNLGKALDRPLEQWLQQYTFPLEARYKDLDYAQKIYHHLVKTLLTHGTTTAVYFATVHREPSLELGKICLELGQRALIGKVAMDDVDNCPSYYRDCSAEHGISETRRFIRELLELPGNEKGRVLPVITPRFIPCCSDELLSGLGELAQETGCHIQTHCSESDWEHNYVIERYGVTDCQALYNHGLMTHKTILAHCNHINDGDISLIKSVSAGIAHCPLSNFYFANSVFPLRQSLNKNLNIGLGSDISAGHSPSVFEACRHAITASKALNDGVNSQLPPELRGCPESSVSFREAFWLATGGGGKVLDLPIGQLREGYLFDAMVIDTTGDESDINIRDDDTTDDILQKLIYTTHRNNICEVWVNGDKVS